MQKWLGTMAALVATCGMAAAEVPDTRREMPTFETVDRNTDDRLSRSEAGFDRLLSEIFANLDTDGDGFVSRAEYAAGGHDPASRHEIAGR